MGKRAPADASGAAAFRKRQKLAHDVPAGEDVTSSDQLRSLLAFEQDMRRARHGLQSFKKLLDDILSNGDDRSTKLAILREYLQLVKPRDTSEDAVFLNDIMEMWSFASQVNDDGVMSSVAVVLALLLNIISDLLDQLPQGTGICQTLLQERQLKSISRNLSAEKAKGFIISPTLRLLREVVSLDGGAFAKRVLRAKAFTFAQLSRNLEIGHLSDNPEDLRKASVRTNAVRFFLSCLRYLHSDGRKELLSQKELLSHLTFMIKSDPPYIVKEILDILKSHVLADSKISREIKFKCFNTKTLMRFLALYTYTHSASPGSESEEVTDKTHQFLLYACTTPGAGILYPSTGLYPKETNQEFSVPSSTGKHTQANSDATREDRFRDGIPVFNFVLSEFASKLRPWSSLKHNELLVAIFNAAPELIADYFFNNRSFTFEPKLSMTWIGYSAFLFNTMRIPLPNSFGDKSQYAKNPPPTSILLDNILPLPINQKVLIRCLSPKSNLTSFFATRILVEALEKLKAAVSMHEEGFRSFSAPWKAAARKLVDAFCQRIPDMKEVVRSYKGIPDDNSLHKTMASRLLNLYYEVIPQVALAANFDVSPFFVAVLRSLNDASETSEPKSLKAIELENLVSIASYSPGMRWFSRIEILQGQGQSTPFVALLRLLCTSDESISLQQLETVLFDVAVENQVISKTTKANPLIGALKKMAGDHNTEELNCIWAFLDNAIGRCATSPLKYLDLLQSYIEDDDPGKATHSSTLNLLTVAMAEQLSFATASATKDQKSALAKFIHLYFNKLFQRQGKELVSCVYSKIQTHFSELSIKVKKLKEKDDKSGPLDDDDEDDGEPRRERGSDQALKEDGSTAEVTETELEEMLHVPFTDEPDTSALVKWHTKSAEDLIEDGHAVALIRLLASEHVNIRKEALTSIVKMAARIKESSYEERDQVWLLLSELAESSRTQIDAGPAPSAFVAFGTHALDVLRNPLHPTYAKVNTFLTKSPSWAPDKLPLAHDILHGEPSEDDRYYAEITWFLAYALDALRTPVDLAALHRRRWFEKILALAANPYLRANLKLRLLRIVYRATRVPDGSTTLITRFGLLSWLDAQRAAAAAAAASEEGPVYAALLKLAWQTCDQKRVAAWSKGASRTLVESRGGSS